MLKIGIDLMSADHSIHELAKGIRKFLNLNKDVECVLFGDEAKISYAFNGHEERVKIVHTTQVIGMTEGAISIRRKKDSSLVKAMKFAKNDEVDAVLSCGSSAAVVSAAYFEIGPIPGIKRPGFMPIAPNNIGSYFVMCDVGASIQNDAQDLENFAIMGTIFCEKILNIKNPRSAIINIGSEKSKGPELLNQAYEKLATNKKINFMGFIEPRYLLNNKADVIVSDGYTGNIALKTLEGTSAAFSHELKKALAGNWFKRLHMAFNPLLLTSIKKLQRRFDYKRSGGALIIGVNKIIVKSHGSSDAKELFYALVMTKKAIKSEMITKFREGLINDEIN